MGILPMPPARPKRSKLPQNEKMRRGSCGRYWFNVWSSVEDLVVMNRECRIKN